MFYGHCSYIVCTVGWIRDWVGGWMDVWVDTTPLMLL